MKTCRKCGNQFPKRLVIGGKERNLQNRGYCFSCSPFGGHNNKALEKPPPDVLVRFSSHVIVLENGCCKWTGCISPCGYGEFKISSKRALAHRVAWEMANGPIPSGLTIDHLCRNRWCVNVVHMEVVTSRENTLRGESPPAVNAKKTHCKYGHLLSGENVRLDKRGHRKCKACDRRTALAHYYKKKCSRVA
jgi:hypothetical protein